MPDRFRFVRSAAKASLVCVLAVTAHGQGQVADDDQLSPPTFRTDVNYVRVDVFVTRDGEPVTDLRPEEFEVFDEGVPQEINQFEYVRIRGNVPQGTRREPNTVAESREMLQNPRARVFVLFLDTVHVGAGASRQIGQPLVDMLDDLIGMDDLIGVMTPQMTARDVAFGRKTSVLQAMLEGEWWGARDRVAAEDPKEVQYEVCYPAPIGMRVSPTAREMIDRRREKMTLDALGDLVRYLRVVREERKALLVITEGWRLFRESGALLEVGLPAALGAPPAAFDPRRGTLGSLEYDDMMSECERDRQMLAMIDNDEEFRQLLDEANRANASFYPVDPRGLAVFDSGVDEQPVPSLRADSARLRTKRTSLRRLASETDGLAVVNTNRFTENLHRVVEDLSSYYLLGYLASGVEMDGEFHEVKVRVSRPGVDVRARRGYLASSREDVLAAAAPAVDPDASLSPTEVARARAIKRAVGSLSALSREMPLRVQVAAGWETTGAASFQVVGEVGRDDEWDQGAEVDVTLATPGGQTLGTSHANVQAGSRGFAVSLVGDVPVPPGDYRVRVRARGQVTGSVPTSDVVKISLPEVPDGAGARFFRRGPSTGNQEVATADLRFRRRERVRIEVPGRAGAVPSARLLDRAGTLLAVPVEAAVRDAGDGTWWVTAEVALAPLAAGDYVIEISGARPPGGAADLQHLWTAFRVVR